MTRPWLLAGGMLVGAALAVYFIARVPDTPSAPERVAAWVNDRPISLDSYDQALEAVASDRKGGVLIPEDRARVLDRLIDQELLIDRAVELGLHERDPQIRNQLSGAMIEFLVQRAEDEAAAADDDALREFYQEERFRFERSPRYEVEVEGSAMPLPQGPLLAKEIEQRLGPTAARTVEGLKPGESAEIELAGGTMTVTLIARQQGEALDFDEAKETVRVAYLRARGEAAVRAFLERARRQSEVRIEVEP